MSQIKNTGDIGQDSPPTGQNGDSVQLAPRKRRRSEAELKYLSSEELQRFFAVIKSKRDSALFRVMYHLGLRASEPGILDLADFRQREGRLKIRRLKGSNGGEYRLPEVALAALRSYVRYERGNEPGALFLSRKGFGINRRTVWDLAVRYGGLAGVAVHPHMFKHSCGTHLAELGEDLLDIQDQLGHKSITSTRRYIGVINKRREDRGQRLRAWK